MRGPLSCRRQPDKTDWRLRCYGNLLHSPGLNLFLPDKRNMKTLTTALLLSLLCSSALAGPGEDRQKSFKKVLLSFEPIGVMLRDGPFRKDLFIKHADALKAAAPAPFMLFKPNTIDDVSRAKPEIWSQPAKFKAEQDKFINAVNALQAGAQTDDLATVRNKYAAVAASCKSCHDSFRGPKR